MFRNLGCIIIKVELQWLTAVGLTTVTSAMKGSLITVDIALAVVQKSMSNKFYNKYWVQSSEKDEMHPIIFTYSHGNIHLKGDYGHILPF